MRGLGSQNILVAKGALGVAYIASAVVYFALKKLKQRMQYNAYEVSEPIFPWYEKVEANEKKEQIIIDEPWQKQKRRELESNQIQ